MRWLLLLSACTSASGPIPGGSVSVFQMETAWQISAAFSDPIAPETKCTHSAGDCVALDYDCAKLLPATPDPQRRSAGTITVGSQVLYPQSDGSYGPISVTGTADSTLPVTSSGAAIPAFSGTITIPAPATLAQPPATAPRDQDLSLTWSGGTAGAKLNVLVYTVTLSPIIQINCSLDAAAGSGVVPASLLQLIPAGAEGHASAGIEIASQPRPTITLSGEANVQGFGLITFN
jgi:hypothetical protein